MRACMYVCARTRVPPCVCMCVCVCVCARARARVCLCLLFGKETGPVRATSMFTHGYLKRFTNCQDKESI